MLIYVLYKSELGMIGKHVVIPLMANCYFLRYAKINSIASNRALNYSFVIEQRSSISSTICMEFIYALKIRARYQYYVAWKYLCVFCKYVVQTMTGW